MKRPTSIIVGAVAAVVVANSAFAADMPGVTDTEIKIGNTTAYSGPASPYSTSQKAAGLCFKMINDNGGINGRMINFISYDDAYSPPKTKEQVRRLVERDEVAFLFNTMGTPTNSAIHEYVNKEEIPHLFLGSGSTKWGQPDKYPWTMGFAPNNQVFGGVYGNYILDNHPDSKVAILYQNDDYGKDYLIGLKRAMGDKFDEMVVATESYEVTDPTISSQIVNLADSGADLFVDIAITKFAAQAIKKMDDIGWKPTHIVSQDSANIKAVFEPAGIERSIGIISATYFKDPGDPAWADDAEMNEWRTFMADYYPEGDVSSWLNVYGWSVCSIMQHVLEQAGDDLSRENIMEQARSVKDFRLRGMLPGIVANTGADDYFPVEQMQMTRFDGEQIVRFGDIVSAR
ncbi:ABC transporter substrate-binding protein [Ruegeria sp.]|uniref:ABC transporter substrate-binding protein n=1 Tax=Ruegeria sp. TaxID=1879320 RepID=UPI003C7A7872